MLYLPEPIDEVGEDSPRRCISHYARGDHYHEIIKPKLQQFGAWLRDYARDEVSEVETRLFVDTGRMVDRAVAQRAGLGWYGKNTNILTKGWGSWVFLAEVVTNLPLGGVDGQYCVSYHRTGGRYHGGTAPLNGQSDLGLRYLPAGVSCEYSGRETPWFTERWPRIYLMLSTATISSSPGISTASRYWQQPGIDTLAFIDGATVPRRLTPESNTAH